MALAVGQKVIIGGKPATINDAVSEPGQVQVTFEDGSRMYVLDSLVTLQLSQAELLVYAGKKHNRIVAAVNASTVNSTAAIDTLAAMPD